MTYHKQHDLSPGPTFLAAVILATIACGVFYALAGAAAVSLWWGTW